MVILMEYEDMLQRLYKSLPTQTKEKSRLEVPKVDSIVQGSKTIVKNFSKIIEVMNRDTVHMLKYLTKETATAVVQQEDKLMLNGKFYPDKLQKIFDDYVKKFVTCKECQKLDTKIVENQGVKMLKCEACGAISPLKE